MIHVASLSKHYRIHEKEAGFRGSLNAFFTTGRFSVSVFPTWARFFLTFVVPIAFITTVPASAAVGRLTLGPVAGSVLMAGILFAASRLFWRYAVANYTSASS